MDLWALTYKSLGESEFPKIRNYMMYYNIGKKKKRSEYPRLLVRQLLYSIEVLKMKRIKQNTMIRPRVLQCPCKRPRPIGRPAWS